MNLATQALLAAHSKSKAYDPKEPNRDLVAKRGSQCDEVGLVWSICVKVCPSP